EHASGPRSRRGVGHARGQGAAATQPASSARRARALAMPVDRTTFAEIMASFPSGVAIVTTLDESGEPKGLTTSAVASVSAEPPLLLVCVDFTSRTLPALRAGGRFLVNFMRAGTAELCRRFASKAEDKYGSVAWRPTESGMPLLYEDAIAWAECVTVQE